MRVASRALSLGVLYLVACAPSATQYVEATAPSIGTPATTVVTTTVAPPSLAVAAPSASPLSSAPASPSALPPSPTRSISPSTTPSLTTSPSSGSTLAPTVVPTLFKIGGRVTTPSGLNNYVDVLVYAKPNNLTRVATATPNGATGDWSVSVPPGTYWVFFSPKILNPRVAPANGSYFNEALAQWWKGVDAYHPSGPFTDLVVDRDLNGVDATLAAGGVVFGRVSVAGTGAGIPANSCDVHSIQPSPYYTSGTYGWGFPDADGYYSMILPNGSYGIYFVGFGRYVNPSGPRNVTVNYGPVRGVDFQVQDLGPVGCPRPTPTPSVSPRSPTPSPTR